MPYKTFATNDVLSAADMNAVTADAVTQVIGSGVTESTTSTSYTDLTTAGPAATSSLVNGQQLFIMWQSRIYNTLGGAGNSANMSFAISGSGTLAASDARAILCQSDQAVWQSAFYWYTAGATGSHTVTCKYAVSASTGNYNTRTLAIKKF